MGFGDALCCHLRCECLCTKNTSVRLGQRLGADTVGRGRGQRQGAKTWGRDMGQRHGAEAGGKYSGLASGCVQILGLHWCPTSMS